MADPVDLNTQTDDWQEEVIAAFDGGVVTDKAPDILDSNQFVESNRVWADRFFLRVDTGYATFKGVIRGIPRATFQFYLTDGSEYLCLITDATFYVLLVDEWQYVSTGVDTTLATAAIATDTALDVASITGFNNGDNIGITMDDGTQHQTTINGAPAGTTINITDAMPGPAAIGRAVVQSLELNGTLDVQVSITVVPSHNWMVFSNGVDVVKRFDGATVEDVPNLPSGGDVVCRIVSLFNDHLLLMHTIEGGTTYPQRVRRSDTGDPTEWVTGNAGYTDLVDSEDFIVASAELGPYQIIYKERSIIRCSYVGSSDLLMNFETMVSGEGALSQDSVSDLGDQHIFVGNSNFYRYRGAFDVEPIGDKIYYKLFGSSGEINPLYKDRTFSVYIEELDEVWFFYAADEATVPNSVVRYKQGDDSWWPRTLNIGIVGFGFYAATSSLTWLAAPDTWEDYSYPWNSQRTTAGSPITHLCGNDPQQVYSYDYVTATDDGTDISWNFVTKDFSQPGYEMRIDYIEMYIQGGDALLEYSTNEGVSWNTYDTIPSAAALRPFRTYGPGQIVTERIRFRLSDTLGAGFMMRWMKIGYRAETLSGL